MELLPLLGTWHNGADRIERDTTAFYARAMRWLDPLLAVCWLSLTCAWLHMRRSAKETTETLRLRARVAYSLPAFAGSLLVISGFAHLGHPLVWPPAGVANWASTVLVVAGLSLALSARVALGRDWSSTVSLKEGHELVQSGPYRWVRHPIYAGLLLMICGTAAGARTYEALIGVTFVLAAVVLKLRHEETLLLRHFPDGYRTYQQRVRRLVPFIW